MSKQGKRIKGHSELDESSVCYWRLDDGAWMLWLPDERIEHFHGLLGRLKNHTVEEHEDWSITVTPSVLVSNRNVTKHGFLTHGVWSEC